MSSCVGGEVVDDCSFADPDDENPCTSDSCDAAGTPVYAPLGAGTSCADADVCNGDETCDGAGACVPGAAPEVDDDNACTADVCDPEAGVLHDPVETGTSCADSDLCNGDETCDPDGTCAPGTPPSVDDANPCTDDACEASGGVIHTPSAVGTSCSDGNACDGEESCDGAGSCQAGTPPEVDDGNPCTADGCDPSSGPTHVPVSAGTSCSNGDACDGAEACDGAGACAPGAPPDLDDENPCTIDSCDPLSGPEHAPAAAGTSCSNGDACDGAETCDGAESCQAGTPVALDDGNPCTADGCDPSTGPQHTPVADGSACDDGDACTTGDACVAGSCTPGESAADDGNPCTEDSCDPVLGPQHQPLEDFSECDDGNLCNGFDFCAQGICRHDYGEDLDFNGCTVDTCDPETGETSFEDLPEGSACESVCDGYGFCESGFCEVTEPYPDFDDGDACTDDECFGDNTFIHFPLVPDDANPCTADSCDSETGGDVFEPLPEGTACEVNCQGSGTCDASATCDITAPPPDPDDGDPCTIDVCDYFLGILHYPAPPGTSCDEDDNECNGTDRCDAAGVCQPGDPSDADDDNPCTVEECAVDPGTGAQTVVHTPLSEGDYCFDDDGDPCNGFNTCVLDFFDNLYCGGPGGPDDGDPCTIDTCDPVNGVSHEPAPIGSECEDGDPCTGAGACDEGGLCQTGQPIDIDDGDACTEDVCYSFDGTVTHDSIDPEDGNPCTEDACDPETGVSHTPAPSGTSCNDFTVCNGAEVCDGAGECQPGTPLVVDDGNPCTIDNCNIVLGVTHTPLPSGFGCSDGIFCNGAESCDGNGSCVPGTPPVVDDGNPCTSDNCSNLGNGGVFHNPRPAGASCSNGDACDGNETCSGSSAQCLAGTPPVVDDGNVCTVDSCDPEVGVTHTPVAMGTDCDDGNLCNGISACSSTGGCVAGPPPDLDDGNPCTVDSCVPASGVEHAPAEPGTLCSPAACAAGLATEAAQCNAMAQCVPGESNDCSPYTCAGPACAESCSDDTQCVASTYCDFDGLCADLLGPTELCIRDRQCVTGACAEGLCCADDVNEYPVINLDSSVASNFETQVAPLYSGPTPSQGPVAVDAIDPEHVAVVHGRVLEPDGTPLGCVPVTVLGMPEVGTTLTRADGSYAIAINGGRRIVLRAERSGYVTGFRQVQPPWHEFAVAQDLRLVPLGEPQEVSADATEITVVSGQVETDDQGTRQATLLFDPGTHASPQSDPSPLDVYDVQVTEVTNLSTGGRDAMPAELPPTSAFTYAVSLTLAGFENESVAFDQPIAIYVNNFLDFPNGEEVPVGHFDEDLGEWVPSDNGRIIQIVSRSASGEAELDIDGAPGIDDPTVLGIDSAERTKLADLYPDGTSLWRFTVQHFSPPWDANWGFKPDPVSEAPDEQDPEQTEIPCPAQSNEKPGSIISCEGQSLGERVPVTGTPFDLVYSSARQPAGTPPMEIPVMTGSVPTRIRGVELEIEVAGQKVVEHFPPPSSSSLPLTYDFHWDGLDGFGRRVYGPQRALVRRGYTFDGSYARTSRFGYAGNGLAISASTERFQATLWQFWRGWYQQMDARYAGLGGWTIDAHHVYDPASKKVFLGTGGTLDASSAAPVLVTIAGNGTTGFSGDGGPAVQAQIDLRVPQSNSSIAIAPDGTVFFTDANNQRVRKVSRDGIITTIAGGGSETSFPYGDGGPALNATFDKPTGIALAPDGSLYVTDKNHSLLRRIDPDGIITSAAGDGTCCTYNGDGPALSRVLNEPTAVTVARDGTVYFTAMRLLRLRDGQVTEVPTPGTTTTYFTGVAGGEDGSLYFSEYHANKLHRVSPSSDVELIAGNGDCCVPDFPYGEGGLATLAPIDDPDGLAISPDGLIYFLDSQHHLVRKINGDGTVQTVAGIGTGAYDGESLPATRTQINRPRGLGFGPDGTLYIVDTENQRIRKTVVPDGAPVASTTGEIEVATRDGRSLFVFSPEGRHLRTLDTYTGITRYAFEYDAGGRLVGIADRDLSDPNRRLTVVERDPTGRATAIVAPDGQFTSLEVDDTEDLRVVTNPRGDTYAFDYEPGGLLVEMRDPKANADGSDPYVFTYDNARLVADQDPLGHTQSLTRSKLTQGWRVTHRTPLSRLTTYDTERLDPLLIRQRTTAPSSLVTESSHRLDGALWFLAPNGDRYSSFISRPEHSFTYQRSDPDAILGMQAPIAAEQLDVMGSGSGAITRVIERSRSIARSDPGDPVSVVTVSESETVNGKTQSTIYDAATRTFTTTSPEGRQSFRVIDERGRTTQTEVPGVLPIGFEYDNADRLTRATQGTRESTWTYDSSLSATRGYLRSMTNAATHTTTYVPDELGRVLEETLGGATTAFDYDPNGNLASVIPPGKSEHTQGYTPLDQLESYSPPPADLSVSETLYTYTADRDLLDVFRPDSTTVHHTYDSAGRPNLITFAGKTLDHNFFGSSAAAPGKLSALVGPYGVNLAFAYNGSLMTSMSWTGAVSGTVSWLYDTDFRRTRETVTAPSGSGFTNFGYDLDSLLTCASPTTCTPPGADALQIARDPQNGRVSTLTLGTVVESLTYNAHGELATKTVTTSGTPLYSVEYDTPTVPRDQLGRVVQKLETVEGTARLEEYGYDVRGRLTDTTVDGVAGFHQEYDDNGNRTLRSGPGGTEEGVYDEQDRLLSYGGWVFTYGANGEIESKADTGTGEAWLFQYDALGNLLRVDLPDGRVIEYLVDGMGRRVGKKVDGVLVRQWLYRDDLKPVAELDGSEALISRFVYASHPLVPDYIVKGGSTYRIVSDQRSMGLPRRL